MSLTLWRAARYNAWMYERADGWRAVVYHGPREWRYEEWAPGMDYSNTYGVAHHRDDAMTAALAALPAVAP